MSLHLSFKDWFEEGWQMSPGQLMPGQMSLNTYFWFYSNISYRLRNIHLIRMGDEEGIPPIRTYPTILPNLPRPLLKKIKRGWILWDMDYQWFVISSYRLWVNHNLELQMIVLSKGLTVSHHYNKPIISKLWSLVTLFFTGLYALNIYIF